MLTQWYMGSSGVEAPPNDAPTVVAPIADKLIREEDPATEIDLELVFSDPDEGQSLAFSEVGQWPSWCTLIGGTVLNLAPAFGDLENDGPSHEITVRATDDGTGTLSVDDTFHVTLLAEASGDVPDDLRPAAVWPESVWGLNVWPAAGPHRSTATSN